MRGYDDELHMSNILDMISLIENSLSKPGGRESFASDRLFRFGIYYAVQKITYCTKLLSADARSLMPEIPWRKLDSLSDMMAREISEPEFFPLPEAIPPFSFNDK